MVQDDNLSQSFMCGNQNDKPVIMHITKGIDHKVY